MFFAPLAFLRSRSPPRTTNKHQNPCILADSHDRSFSIEFYTPTPPGAFFSKQVFPPNNSDRRDGGPSLFNPPAHYHLLQDELFKVESGAGIWRLWGGRTVRLEKGDETVVPALRWHCFESAPESDEPLKVLYRYEREYAEMEECFFRNTFSYMADCRKAGMQPSIFQMTVFCMHNWMPLAVQVPGPEWLNLVVSTIIMLVVGFVGEFLLGYKASYPEYYSGNAKTG